MSDLLLERDFRRVTGGSFLRTPPEVAPGSVSAATPDTRGSVASEKRQEPVAEPRRVYPRQALGLVGILCGNGLDHDVMVFGQRVRVGGIIEMKEIEPHEAPPLVEQRVVLCREKAVLRRGPRPPCETPCFAASISRWSCGRRVWSKADAATRMAESCSSVRRSAARRVQTRCERSSASMYRGKSARWSGATTVDRLGSMTTRFWAASRLSASRTGERELEKRRAIWVSSSAAPGASSSVRISRCRVSWTRAARPPCRGAAASSGSVSVGLDIRQLSHPLTVGLRRFADSETQRYAIVDMVSTTPIQNPRPENCKLPPTCRISFCS